MPQIAVFPKAYMQALCKDGSMRLKEWIELAVKLEGKFLILLFVKGKSKSKNIGST